FLAVPHDHEAAGHGVLPEGFRTTRNVPSPYSGQPINVRAGVFLRSGRPLTRSRTEDFEVKVRMVNLPMSGCFSDALERRNGIDRVELLNGLRRAHPRP